MPENLFNNPSIAAFVGAFSAFILVMTLDAVRRRRRKRLLKSLVADNQDLARLKIETIRSIAAKLRDEKRFNDAPIMPFPSDAIRHHMLEVLDLLNSNQSSALHGLIYWMEAIDESLEENRTSKRLLKDHVDRGATEQEWMPLYDEILVGLADAERNLEYFVEQCNFYISGAYHKVSEFEYPDAAPKVE